MRGSRKGDLRPPPPHENSNFLYLHSKITENMSRNPLANSNISRNFHPWKKNVWIRVCNLSILCACIHVLRTAWRCIPNQLSYRIVYKSVLFLMNRKKRKPRKRNCHQEWIASSGHLLWDWWLFTESWR